MRGICRNAFSGKTTARGSADDAERSSITKRRFGRWFVSRRGVNLVMDKEWSAGYSNVRTAFNNTRGVEWREILVHSKWRRRTKKKQELRLYFLHLEATMNSKTLRKAASHITVCMTDKGTGKLRLKG
ncbi:unnamed protein product [Sphagnum troendelagicum]|uniref:Uncharacterized protein n=1 Tax=Sphagnum troendelagicum TaxID=128251 RepID=A0ABP0U7K9_9BRYO